jgi:hypothetical protein
MSERWAASFRNGGRLQIGRVGDIARNSQAVAHHGLACQRWRFGPRDAHDIITGVDVAFFEKGSIKALIRLR